MVENAKRLESMVTVVYVQMDSWEKTAKVIIMILTFGHYK
jgi:hypothetical protein